MGLSTVVWIVVIIALVVLSLKVLKKMISLTLSVAGIVLVVWLVVAGLRYMDESNVRNNLMDSNNLFLLQEGDSLITGFATQEDTAGQDLEVVQDELDDPTSDLYDSYYKVIIVNKESLPEKTSLLVEVSDKDDQLNLFKSYVKNGLLEGDYTSNLVDEEKEGNIEVRKETLAFRHGLREVFGS
ncbi:MAG: hypothetical protein V1729_01710 [Candidatus Woesearchaeota archaeon]